MRILFVCTGNTCRSPMAEGLFRQMAREAGVPLEVKSAGVAAIPGMSISRHAEAVLRDQHIHDPITSSSLDETLTDWADVILTLTQSHKQQVIYRFPSAASKTFVLKEYAAGELGENNLKELDALLAEGALRAALGQKLDDKDNRRIAELRRQMPIYDISDPYGGSREDYEQTAREIREALEKVLARLQQRDRQS
jgi:protein-tyrosine-phosphatase